MSERLTRGENNDDRLGVRAAPGEDSGNVRGDGYWSKEQAATYLGLKPHTMDYLVRTGKVAFFKIAGKRRFSQADLDAYAARNRVDSVV